ncbi:hypothetical protein D1B33_18075 [Lysinibacillus yapensis]|uniref:Uncharacterized protein n=1 Tax=Ureibacillus yapensis TaxID=2304605 RepID=A0A396S3Q4_9BACL|nr:hypothetical protein [Lysinibacillus yapensis]RHW31115.1 hypothetical protein D1B33_18075 [Lysinibacillus yapensis]
MAKFTKEQIDRAKANGVAQSTLYTRVGKLGWDVEKAITTPSKSKTPSMEYNEGKLQRVRKRFGNELTFSIYKQIKELGFSDREIQRMYELKYHEVYSFLKNHKQILEEAQ